MNRETQISEVAKAARLASHVLANIPAATKNEILRKIAGAIRENKDLILNENRKDLPLAQDLVRKNELSHAYFNRLLLDESKIEQMALNLESVVVLRDPVGQIKNATELSENLDLYQVTCPIGVLLVIFESRPEVVIQVAALTIKSGNAVILKGGKEAYYSNNILLRLIQMTLAGFPEVPPESVSLINTRDEVSELLKFSDFIDLVIPRGSKTLVKYIQSVSKIPVLAHADGNCHVFVDYEADFEKAFEIVLDSKIENPSVCNALETLLVHENFDNEDLNKILQALNDNKVELRVCEKTKKRLEAFNLLEIKDATEQDWETEYTDYILAVKTVSGTREAVDHINKFGSKHTDAIVTENQMNAELFMASVDSSSVFWNASTRFADGFRYGFGAEIGISTNKIHARGPVGLDGLVIYKYKLYGKGQGVRRFTLANKESFTHKPISINK